MRTSFRRFVLASTATLALALSPASALPDAGTSDRHDNGAMVDSRNSDNLELVARLPGTGGTDVEFFSRDLPRYRDAEGNVVEEDSIRHFALVGNQSTGAWIVDITDPENPYVVDVLSECRVGQGDPQTSADGTFALIASQSGSCRLADGRQVTQGSIIVDLSDPYNATPISFAPGTAHNNTLHPSGDYIYISSSALASAGFSTIPIYDISDRTKPVKVNEFSVPANGPHDIRFNPKGTRAYTAGVSTFQIFDTTDPENPELISTIVPPGGTIGHDSLVTRDGRFLFLGDEAGGGGTYPCPGGAVYVYDLMDERAPVLIGAVEAGGGPVSYRHYDETPGPTGLGGCTSHVMELNPDGQSLTLGWYRLGFRIFDFSSFYNADGTPKDVAGVAAAWGENGVGMVETGYMVPDGANTWSAKQYAKVPGYVFADDLALGFYVTKIKD